jgi:hypothetical protein
VEFLERNHVVPSVGVLNHHADYAPGPFRHVAPPYSRWYILTRNSGFALSACSIS